MISKIQSGGSGGNLGPIHRIAFPGCTISSPRLAEHIRKRQSELTIASTVGKYTESDLLALYERMDGIERHLDKFAGRPVRMDGVAFLAQGTLFAARFKEIGVNPSGALLGIVPEKHPSLTAQLEYDLFHEYAHLLLMARIWAETAIAPEVNARSQQLLSRFGASAYWSDATNVSRAIFGSLNSTAGFNHSIFGRLNFGGLIDNSIWGYSFNRFDDLLVDVTMELLALRAGALIAEDEVSYARHEEKAVREKVGDTLKKPADIELITLAANLTWMTMRGFTDYMDSYEQLAAQLPKNEAKIFQKLREHFIALWSSFRSREEILG